ncbi:MAG: hypothetical protein HRF40_08370 [Nitrososphaera sp.]|jgi:hypothetical protein
MELNYRIFVVLSIIISAIAIGIVATANYGRLGVKPEPVPTIVIVYDGLQHAGMLDGYVWQGQHIHVDLSSPDPSKGDMINVTKGSIIEFLAINASRQPDYYLVTIADPQVEQTTLEEVRLDANRLPVELEEGKRYVMHVAGVWTKKIGPFIQSEDSVAYSYKISVAGKDVV